MGVTLLRWGMAEYEHGPLVGLPPDVVEVLATGPDAPLEAADVLVVPSKARVDAEVVRRLTRCRLVITTTSGHDHLDLVALARAGIVVSRLPHVRRDAVVETALGMILGLTRRLGALQEAAVSGRWERARLVEHGATRIGTVAVVGVGVIGSHMCTVLRALGATVLRVDPRLADGVPLAEALSRANVVTLHCSLNPANLGMIGQAALATMRPGAVLVNTARGKLVDVEAAVAAVRAGHLAGLGLDVFPAEPADLARWAAPNVVLTPHAAGWHPRLGQDVAEGVAEAVRAILAGMPVPHTLVPDSVEGEP
ncbi:MAG: NAD(P)-dependent oxidoreductase [Pseudomonadota bacterium]|nr:NAD(P)-dependent oxidoreductase [Pseudomonadota bacterium]